jgi:hypothetical protein
MGCLYSGAGTMRGGLMSSIVLDEPERLYDTPCLCGLLIDTRATEKKINFQTDNKGSSSHHLSFVILII